MNKLIIAEKPMLARDIARVMCGKSGMLPIRGNGYTVVACAGHLLELKEPEEIDPKWKEWTLDSLPINPKFWPKKISNGKKELINIIKKELKNCDSVIHAGDPDDEGQLIVDEVLEFLQYKGKVERVFVNDSIDKNIKKAFDNLVNNDKCINTGKAALARQIADFTFGANESRLACIKCGKTLPVGRVLTPTLGLVVNRDNIIAKHIKQKYYELFLKTYCQGKNFTFSFIPNESFCDEDKYIFNKSKIEKLANGLKGSFRANVKNINKEEYSPLPYNLTKLQSAMSKKYGYSAQDTLNITQILRDKYKAITYNRTDCQYLSEEHFKEAGNVIKCVLNNFKDFGKDYNLNQHHKAFNDKNISAHHAIIPQEININVEDMEIRERRVYKEICEAYINLFRPPLKYVLCSIEKPGKKGKLKYEAKKIIDFGWKGRCDEQKPFLKEGIYTFRISDNEIHEKETTPPKPYTEGTLIADMSSIAKYCNNEKIKQILKEKDKDKKGEHGGIGTTATRGQILENLKKRGYVEKKGKNIASTNLGKEFYKIIPNNIKTADLTALWWLMQEEVANGRAGINCISENVIEVFLQHKDTAYNNINFKQNRQSIGRCPNCGNQVIISGKICQCETNKYKKNGKTYEMIEGCGFKFMTSICGKSLTKKNLADLLSHKEISVSGLKSKKGKKFTAKVVLSSDLNKSGFSQLKLKFFK